jgi:hypothetical protein
MGELRLCHEISPENSYPHGGKSRKILSYSVMVVNSFGRYSIDFIPAKAGWNWGQPHAPVFPFQEGLGYGFYIIWPWEPFFMQLLLLNDLLKRKIFASLLFGGGEAVEKSPFQPRPGPPPRFEIIHFFSSPR